MSPIPMRLCLPGAEITDIRARPGGLAGGLWVSGVLTSSDSSGSSVSRVVMWKVSSPGVMVELLGPLSGSSSGFVPMAGRGLSGGAHAWHPNGESVFVCTRESGVVRVDLVGDSVAGVSVLPLPVGASGSARSWFTPDVNDTSIYVVADWQELWRFDFTSGEARCVCAADDGFVVDACASGGGKCHTWQRPEMSWTSSSVWPEVARAGVAVQQPRMNSAGTSYGFIDDSRGVANVCVVADSVVDTDVFITDDCEHGGPVWGPGQRTWCFNSTGTHVAYTRNEKGFGSLWVYDRVTGERTFVGRGIHGCVSWEGNTLVALRSGARTPQQVVVYDMSVVAEPVRTVLVQVADASWNSHEFESELVEPMVCEAIGSNGVVVPYRMYQPAGGSIGVILWVHGGPTDQWQVTFRPRLTYWLSRGYSIAVVDHRGTTGHGRAFASSLEGHWGEFDAIDTVAVMRTIITEHGFKPHEIVLMGGSAGGLSVLNAAAMAPELVKCAVVSYPVVDLGELMRGNDPFETHYMPALIGSSDPGSELVRDRSPLSRAASLAQVPLLVFHGDNDTSVPLVHSLRLQEAVAMAGGSVQLVVMEGEGHGFKNPDNVTREFAVTEDFISRTYG